MVLRKESDFATTWPSTYKMFIEWRADLTRRFRWPVVQYYSIMIYEPGIREIELNSMVNNKVSTPLRRNLTISSGLNRLGRPADPR